MFAAVKRQTSRISIQTYSCQNIWTLYAICIQIYIYINTCVQTPWGSRQYDDMQNVERPCVGGKVFA